MTGTLWLPGQPLLTSDEAWAVEPPEDPPDPDPWRDPREDSAGAPSGLRAPSDASTTGGGVRWYWRLISGGARRSTPHSTRDGAPAAPLPATTRGPSTDPHGPTEDPMPAPARPPTAPDGHTL